MNIYMSRAELEEISEGLIKVYAQRFNNRVIQYIDIEHFITEFLMLKIEYSSFAEDDAGRIGFLADGETPLLIHQEGLSVPDSDMLISISEVLETPVSTLLGETVIESKADDLKAISEKLEVINLQFAQRKTTRRKILHWSFIILCAIIVIIFAVLIVSNSPYLGWDYSDPETAVVGVGFHIFEWLFVRIAPITLIGAIVGAFLT